MKFQDYYETLGVERSASQAEITKAFRGLARKFHPDVNKSPEAEDKFKEINEAYEVLSNPENRKRYDALGQNWKAGQDFNPPPEWADLFSNLGGGSHGPGQGFSFQFGGEQSGGFSDFFNSLFGGSGFNFGAEQMGGQSHFHRPPPQRRKGASHRGEVTISLEDAYRGTTKSISLETMEPGQNGTPQRKVKTYQVKIPAGITDGKTIRLGGQGSAGAAGGASGDLLLKVKIAPHARYRTKEETIYTNVPVSPWEAALGSKVRIETLDGPVTLTIPPGSQNGQQLRLREKGLSAKTGKRGDMLAELKIVLPKKLSDEEKELLEKLKEVSKFNPRA